MIWWLWRRSRTRSHPELGRETLQRQWYSVLRRGRVGRRQVFKQPVFTCEIRLDMSDYSQDEVKTSLRPRKRVVLRLKAWENRSPPGLLTARIEL